MLRATASNCRMMRSGNPGPKPRDDWRIVGSVIPGAGASPTFPDVTPGRLRMPETWMRPDCDLPPFFYGWDMKKHFLNPTLALTGAVTATLLTGCASNPGYSDVPGPPSALAFTTVTDPTDLSRWSMDRYLMFSLRSIDTYYFRVPDTGYRPGGSEVALTSPAEPGIATTAPAEATVPEGVGVGAGPGPYQSGTGSYRIIEYRPGQAR